MALLSFKRAARAGAGDENRRRITILKKGLGKARPAPENGPLRRR